MTKTDIQIRFADVDVFNHVNNINLQHYYDLGKMMYYREVMGLKPGIAEESIVIVNCCSNYYAPVRIEDQITVETSIEKIGNKSITFWQQIVEKSTRKVKSDCRSILATFNAMNNESIPVPEKWRETIQKHESNNR